MGILIPTSRISWPSSSSGSVSCQVRVPGPKDRWVDSKGKGLTPRINRRDMDPPPPLLVIIDPPSVWAAGRMMPDRSEETR